MDRMKLKEVRTRLAHYYVDEYQYVQGEAVWSDGSFVIRGMFKDDVKHGEIVHFVNGRLEDRSIWIYGDRYKSVNKISEEEKLRITLKYDLKWIPNEKLSDMRIQL